MDPHELACVIARWPLVVWKSVEGSPLDLDGCTGCPTAVPARAADSVAVLAYRYGGRTVRQPVGGCCLTQELQALRRLRIHHVTVEVLIVPDESEAA